MSDIIRREFVYIWYYFDVQLRQIFGYWVAGMVIGSLISVFAKDKIHGLVRALNGKKTFPFGLIAASLLGVASPLCLYSTVPLAASLSKEGLKDDWLAAFMMSSILLNPQLIVYSLALGSTAVWVRLISCTICGIVAGLLIQSFYKGKPFFSFGSMQERESHDTDPNPLLRFIKNLGRNIKATGGYFLVGILLTALFQRYVPAEEFADLFGNNRGFGVLLAATIGVPLYACGGGTIPLLQEWLRAGMSMGSASAFMITGPATKITNLGALKIVLGMKRFLLYWGFIMLFSLLTGLLVNLIV